MQLTRCPTCHARISLDALVQDAAGRELLTLVASLEPPFAGALLSYLSLFRSPSRDLANHRALSLSQQTLALSASRPKLQHALEQTSEQLRQQGLHKPLKNHNYLKRVLDSSHPPPLTPHTQHSTRLGNSATARALHALEESKQ